MKVSKDFLAALATVAAIGFGIAGTFIAPQGIIDSSMLYLIAQLLLYAATLLGFGSAVQKIAEMLGKKKE